MRRRNFIKKSLLAGTSSMVGIPIPITTKTNIALKEAKPFNMKFSPEFGIFSKVAGNKVDDQIRWGYDQGFRAWENSYLKSRDKEEQELISSTLQKLGMDFGQFVGTMDFKEVTFAGRNEGIREFVLKEVRDSVEIAKRMNTKFVHNVLGVADPSLPWDFQLANSIELLKKIRDIYEPHGIVMVMESINHRYTQPSMFLHSIPQAYALAKALDSPSVKILFDFYHVQIQEGNLLPTLDYAWDEIAYIQMGDTPGRNEPNSGEINFRNVLQHIHDKGYQGFVGLEHGTSKPGIEGELIALESYRIVDPK